MTTQPASTLNNGSPVDTAAIHRAALDHYGDLRALGALIATAFADLSAVRWLVPGPRAHRSEIFGRWAELHIADALTRGHVDVIDGPDSSDLPLAVAVWFTNPHAAPAPDYDQQLQRAVSRTHIDRFRTLDAVMDDAHPGGLQHHHLLLLAVHPAYQDQGYGSKLLAHHHRELDDAGLPGYLEAASPDSARLYQRHGYAHLDEPLTLPGNTSPDLWPMWRNPRTTPTAS
ncbi:GNAT family N-acetyltransferase [Cryptosporangium sp. NPDC048952]|uniref:GNAT family N-acetyltransferase n=1 Tax=Cryptosporangium sp. NPDC048952 TaxID=3363961 RepID=UPI003719D625